MAVKAESENMERGANVAMKDVGGVDLGYEIGGVDLSLPFSDLDFSEKILRHVRNNSAVVIRGQHLTVEQFVNFGRRFGVLERHIFNQHLMDGFPEVLHLTNITENGKPLGRTNPGSFWHTDLTYTAQPNAYSLLYAIEVPHDAAGNPLGSTCFRSTAAAYQTLSDELKSKIEGRNAKHFHLWARRRTGDNRGIELTPEQEKRMANIVHPIIGKQTDTGRKYLFVNHSHTERIVGMNEAESDQILGEIYDHIATQYTYAHNWKVGDVVIWDNLTTQHYATLDYEPHMRRRLLRLSVEGHGPVSAT